MIVPSNRELLIGAGAVVAAVVVLYVVAKKGPEIGRALGQGVGGLAVGGVVGIGDALGLPDPSNQVTYSEGQQALDSGDYLGASMKLPALDFLGGVGSQFGLWWYEVTHGDENPGGAVAIGDEEGLEPVSPFQVGA